MTNKSPKDRFQSLTKREKEVLQLVCQQNGYQKIADELFIGKTTVKTHMHNIYVKLGLDNLDRDERVLQIHNIYCPLFSEVKEPKERSKKTQIVPVEPEPEPLAPDEEEIIDGDEMALIAYTPQTIMIGGKQKKMEGTKKKKRGCFKYVFGFILGVACTIGAWQGWLYVKEIPVVISLIEIINPDFIQQPEVEAVTVETPYTQPVAESTVAPTAKSAEKTSVPVAITTETTSQVMDYGEVYEMNEWYKQDGVWLRMYEYEVNSVYITFEFEMWNKSGQDLYFAWAPKDNFSLTDNQGNYYKARYSYSGNEKIANEERLELHNNNSTTLEYDNDPIYGSGVTDLYITVEYLSRIDKAVFHIPIGK